MAEERERGVYLRRAELFLEPSHHPQRNIHKHLYILRDSTAVELGVWSPRPREDDSDPPSFEEAIKQDYRPASVGEEFGPAWSTHWFRVRVLMPKGQEWAEKRITFRWESGCEALVWSATGVPLQAFSEQDRDSFHLCDSAKPGEYFLFYIVRDK
jgi:alpha-mannosidase